MAVGTIIRIRAYFRCFRLMSLSSRWRRLALASTRSVSAFFARALRTRILSRCSFSALCLVFSALRRTFSAFRSASLRRFCSRSSTRRDCFSSFRIRSHSLSLARSSLFFARTLAMMAFFAAKTARSSRFFFRSCSARTPCISLRIRVSLISFACFLVFRAARSFSSLWLTSFRPSGRNSALVLFDQIIGSRCVRWNILKVRIPENEGPLFL